MPISGRRALPECGQRQNHPLVERELKWLRSTTAPRRRRDVGGEIGTKWQATVPSSSRRTTVFAIECSRLRMNRSNPWVHGPWVKLQQLRRYETEFGLPSLYGRDFRRLVCDVEKAYQARTPQRYARLRSGRLTPPTAPEMHEDFLHFAIRGNRRTSRVGRAEDLT